MDLNRLYAMFGGYQNFQQQFNAFAQSMGQPGQMNPQQIVQGLMQSGRMTQDQFNQLSQMANTITGKRQF